VKRCSAAPTKVVVFSLATETRLSINSTELDREEAACSSQVEAEKLSARFASDERNEV
jgi:hypothetical protein